MNFIEYILTALALVLVIEGLLYALFPDMMRKMMAQAVLMPVKNLRIIGGITALGGVLTAWLVSIF